jgi:hypothetical protein
MIDDLLDDILRRLDSMEEKLQPLGCHLVGVEGDGDGALHTDGGDGTTPAISTRDVLAAIGGSGGALDVLTGS